MSEIEKNSDIEEQLEKFLLSPSVLFWFALSVALSIIKMVWGIIFWK